ncbi:MAG: hypothetical protein ABI718_10025 [Acidobacteriota bacterium]
MKLFRSSLVLILSVASTHPLLASKSPIAPLPPRLGDLAYNDLSARSARGGDSVLVVWENEPTIYPETGSVYGRVLEPGHEASTSFLIRRSATSPVVSWNGKSWVVGYGIANSRFNPYQYDNVVVRTVSPDGTLGAEHVLNRSADNYPTLSDIVWTGTSWIVVFEHHCAGEL